MYYYKIYSLTNSLFSFHSYEALAASEGKINDSIEHTDETHEAISWYNRILGFHVKGGRGNCKLFFPLMVSVCSSFQS
jgi:hypothetical protein